MRCRHSADTMPTMPRLHPSPFPATGDKNPPEMYILTEGSKGYGEGEATGGNGREENRARTGMKDRRDPLSDSPSKSETLVPSLPFSPRVVCFFE